MELVKKEVEVSKAADQLRGAIVALIKVVKVQLADGFQIGNDIGPLVAEAMKDIPIAVAAMDQAKADLGSNPDVVLKSLGLGVGELAGLFVAPKAPEVLGPVA